MQPYTDQLLDKVVKDSTSVAQVLRRIGRSLVGTNYRWFHRERKRLQLNVDHFQPYGLSPQSVIPWGDVLIRNSPHPMNSGRKKRLLAEGFLEKKCSFCGILDWCGKPLSLHLDHINGQRQDNRLDNLRLLCPNCHSQTDTYCGRNKRNPPEFRECPCGRMFTPTHKKQSYCDLKCANDHKPKHKPPLPKEDLEALVWMAPTTKVAEALGISDVAVAKWCKKLKIEKPPRGYWQKVEHGKLP